MSVRTAQISSRVFGDLRSSKKSSAFPKGKPAVDSVKSGAITSRSDLQELINKIESMKNMKHVPIKNLEKKKQQELEDLKSAAMLLRKGKNYSLVVDAIKNNFATTNDIQPDTVGAFFYGCFMETFDEGCLACSAYCAGSMPVPPTPGWKDCDKSVAIYSDGELTIRQINDTSDEMLIYAISGDFRGLSDSDVKKLKNMGTRSVIVINSSTSYSHNGSSKASTPTMTGTPDSVSRKSLNCGESLSTESSQYSSSDDDCTTPSSGYTQKRSKSSGKDCKLDDCDGAGSGWGIIAVVVLLVFIIIIAGFVYWYFSRGAVAETTVLGPKQSAVVGSGSFFGPGYKCA